MTAPGAATRAQTYGALRWGFLPTSPQAWLVIRSPDWYDDLKEATQARPMRSMHAELRHLEETALRFPDADAWQAAYHSMFSTGPDSLLETDYTAAHSFMQARELADIAGFYRAFGYDGSPSVADRVDHLGAELEFLYVLAHREARLRGRGDHEGADVCLDATRKFLAAHVGRFAPRLDEQIHGPREAPFFRSLVTVAAAVIRQDVADFGLHPAPLPPRTAHSEPEDVTTCGPCDPSLLATGIPGPSPASTRSRTTLP